MKAIVQQTAIETARLAFGRALGADRRAPDNAAHIDQMIADVLNPRRYAV